ncbi:MFS transporter [Candidatus Gracilibacteria bacterium]|nr:MFS transporter [Candidatus Gracilibacteria bacterium]
MKNTFLNMMKSRFFIVFLITFVNGLSFTMLFPVLPFIIKIYEAPEVVLGILLGTFSLFQFLAAPILGSLSDKYGRKPILIITQAGTMLSWVVLGVSYLLPEYQFLSFISLPILVIFLSRVFDGITGGNNSVAQAIIADLSTPSERTKVFGMNGAIMGLAIVVGPSIGAFSMGTSYGYLGTAIAGTIISFITLLIMIFFLQESIAEEDKKSKIKISLKNTNLFAQISKWGKFKNIRYTIFMKICMFSAFVGYTSISALYLIDVFRFDAINVGYYMTFTGMFLIFHQTVSIRYFVKKFRDRKSLYIGMIFMGLGFLAMASTKNIILFTVFYFFAVLGISLSWSTLSSLFSRSVDKKNQGEIMGMVAGLESFISVGIPILATLIYTHIDFSIYFLLSILPLVGVLISSLVYKNIHFETVKEAS